MHNEYIDEYFDRGEDNAAAEQADMDQWQDFLQPVTSIHAFNGLTKNKIRELAKTAVENVRHNGNSLEVAEALSCMENFIKEIRADKRFTDEVREQDGKSYVTASGAKIEQAETGTAYDFSKCNDPELAELETAFEQAKSKVDERKGFLKTIPLSGIDIITKDGEGVKIYPPAKSSTSSFKVTLSKI